MILLSCPICMLALRTSGDFDEVNCLVGAQSEWYPNRYPCARSECEGKMLFSEAVDSRAYGLLEVHDLSPTECFQALLGMGLPEERAVTAEVLSELVGKRIIKIDIQPVLGDRRPVLKSLFLEDGTRIYLGASPQGAMAYRVASRRSTTEEFTDG